MLQLQFHPHSPTPRWPHGGVGAAKKCGAMGGNAGENIKAIHQNCRIRYDSPCDSVFSVFGYKGKASGEYGGLGDDEEEEEEDFFGGGEDDDWDWEDDSGDGDMDAFDEDA